MSAVACYFRLTVPTDPDGKLAAAATQAVEQYARGHLPEADRKGTFVEAATARSLAFGQRTVGIRAQLSLERGDHLVIAEAGPAFKNWGDFLMTTRLWECLGIVVHFISPPANSMTPEGRRALELLKEFARAERNRRAERAREGNAKRRLAGKPANQHAPYGLQNAGRRGFRRRVRDDYTREVGKRIVEWRLIGHTWEGIYFHLLRHGVWTRDGREWSIGAIRRAFVGECRLQIQETEDADRP
jgi:hypothetical protein